MAKEILKKYSKDFTLLPSSCDSDGKLGYPNCFAVFMDIASEHAERIDVGLHDLSRRSLFWLTVKTKIRFFKRPEIMSEVRVSTWPLIPGKIRCIRDYTIERDGELLVAGKTEWAVVNTDNGKLAPMRELFEDGAFDASVSVCEGDFGHIESDFSSAELLGKYRVCPTDIDVGGHMNNAAYVRAVFSLLGGDRAIREDIEEIEVHFRKSCFEGEDLSVFISEEGRERKIGVFRPDGSQALYMNIKSR